MIDRRVFLAVAGIVTAGPRIAHAQNVAKPWRIGVFTPGNATATQPLFDALRQGMKEHGYREGQQIVFERRFGGDQLDRFADVAAELVRSRVDLIVTSTDAAIAAVKQQTRTIPIVMANSTDPVATGFAASLAHPGGNITGNSSMAPALSGKRLEVLREIVPGLRRVAVLWNPDIRGAVLEYQATESVATSFRLLLQSVEVGRAADLDRALGELTGGGVDALIVPGPNPLAYANRRQIVAWAQRHRLPAIYPARDFAEAGGLIAFGPSPADQWRRAATYVDKILKGAKPADLPIEQPTTFELIINLNAAKAVGLTIPQSILLRADHLIR